MIRDEGWFEGRIIKLLPFEPNYVDLGLNQAGLQKQLLQQKWMNQIKVKAESHVCLFRSEH